jgi:hypothetical protein
MTPQEKRNAPHISHLQTAIVLRIVIVLPKTYCNHPAVLGRIDWALN